MKNSKCSKTRSQARRESGIDSRSSAWHWGSTEAVAQTIMNRRTVTAAPTARRLASGAPPLSAFHALRRASTKKSKFPFRIHHQRTFPVRQTIRHLINSTLFTTRSTERNPRRRDYFAAARHLADAIAAISITTSASSTRTFWVFRTRERRRELARRWGSET